MSPLFSIQPLKAQILKSRMGKAKAAIYARVSSTANKDGAGISRQTSICEKQCKATKTKVTYKVAEVVSGSLPLAQRNVFNDLMEKCSKDKISKLVVEGSRAFSRNAYVSEAIYEKSKELGIQIVPVVLPDLCEHQPNPAQKFLRRVMFAYTELEKDMTVSRLQHGWGKKMASEKQKLRTGKPVRLNQAGKVKINGRKGILESTNLSPKQRKQLHQATNKYNSGQLTVREAAVVFSRILGKKKAGVLKETYFKNLFSCSL